MPGYSVSRVRTASGLPRASALVPVAVGLVIVMLVTVGMVLAVRRGGHSPGNGGGAASSGNAVTPGAPTTSAAGTRAVRLPPVGGVFDYQIGGGYPPAPGVAIVERDHTERPASGRYGICYINAFQTQPGERSRWPAAALLRGPGGGLVADAGWPGEYLLDTSTRASRTAIESVLGPWLDGCAANGYSAVEPDNLDSWTRSGGLLTEAGNVALARWIVTRAHALGLAVAQKNAAGLARTGHTRVGFDFAVVEECQFYHECGAFIAGYGRQVYEIEYVDSGGKANFAAACRARGTSISVIYRDREVVPAGTPGYVYRHC